MSPVPQLRNHFSRKAPRLVVGATKDNMQKPSEQSAFAFLRNFPFRFSLCGSYTPHPSVHFGPDLEATRI